MLDAPTLIVHGRDDFLIPAEAAIEHHRLVPQSELVLLPTGHFFIFGQDSELWPPLEDFLARVGTIFLDGGRFLSPQLERTVDAISRSFEGFFFGRYDVRVASIADFRAGRGLMVLELNGVTSESTDIYDPRNSLRTA